MPTSSTYPSIPIPQNNTDSLHQAVSAMRQTIQLLIVNSQQITDQTITKASQIFSKKDDHTDISNTVKGSLTSINKSITDVNKAVGDLQTSVTALQGQVAALTTRMVAVEGRTSSLENRMHTAETNIDNLLARVTAIEHVTNHDVRIRCVSTTLNNAVANGAALRFDTIDYDSDGFAPITSPFDTITIPPRLGGSYVLTAWASGNGNQSTTLGMGVFLNGTQKYSSTNQSISGPGSVSYVLNNPAVEVLHLNEGDTLQMINNSVTGGTNVFTSITLAMVRIEVP